MEVFKEYTSKSAVWNHFLRSSSGLKAKCKHCNKVLASAGGSTSTLKIHLKKQHNLNIGAAGATAATSIPTAGPSSASIPSTSQNKESQKRSESQKCTPVDSEEPPSKKRKMTDYFESEQSMEMTVTRMVTLDGLTFRVFVNSVDLVRLFKKSGYTLPKSANSIRRIVLNECEKAKLKVTHNLMQFTKKGYKLYLTADEWSSTRNRRYININLHSPYFESTRKYINLGLVRIVGSATAAKCGSLIKERLESFSLSFNDVVGLTTDGASVMVKMGKGLPAYHQLCYAHALQLAVLDVLYKTGSTTELENDEFQQFGSDIEEDDSSDSEEDGIFIIDPTERYRILLLNINYEPLISKVRNVVKLFRKSPTKNDQFLQKHVLQDHGKDINLIIDCKTRWSSLCNMIERFVMLYPSVQKALVDLKSHIRFSDDEIQLLTHAYEVLEIVRSVLEILCKEDATLLTADTALKHMFKKLKDMANTGRLSAQLLAALRKIIGDRYILLQGVLKYLHSPKEFFEEPQSDIFEKPSPDIITKIVTALATQSELTSRQTETVTSAPSSTDEPTDSQSFKSFKDELLHKLAGDSIATTSSSTPATSTSVSEDDCAPQMILFEMALHENGGQRGKYLSQAYQQLLSIKPTSVEAERAFSTAGYFCSKLRSRLSDTTLDALMFLRSYIMSQMS